MRYRLIIFDYDGTLADSLPWFLRVLNELADEFHFNRLEEKDYERVRSFNTRQLLKHFGLPLWKVPRVAGRMRALAARDRHEIPLFPGILGALETLARAGIHIAIVSSNSEENIRATLGSTGSACIKSFSCGASLLGKAARLRQVLRRAGIFPSESLFIGDELRDAEAAASANLPFGAVSWGYNSVGALARQSPAHLFRSVAEIAALGL